MKKIILGTVVTALILFFVQAMNWTALPVHKHALKYTPDQDRLLSLMSETLEEGYYFMPYFDPDNTSAEEQNKLSEEMNGKPWAIISYHGQYDQGMGLRMAAGFLIDLMAAFIVVIILAMVSDKIPTFGGRWFFVLSLAILIIVQGPLMGWNWWDTPQHFLTSLVYDLFSTWGIAGLWLAWYFRPQT